MKTSLENFNMTKPHAKTVGKKLPADSPSDEQTAVSILQEALDDGKASDIRILSVEKQAGGLFSWMIVTTANSPRHAAALAERSKLALKAAGFPIGQIEGGADKLWVLLDAGDVILHIMQAETRAHYDLESLWGFEEAGE